MLEVKPKDTGGGASALLPSSLVPWRVESSQERRESMLGKSIVGGMVGGDRL